MMPISFIKLRVLTILLLSLLCIHGQAHAQMTFEQPWPGPKGASLFIEAETFRITGPGWTVLEDDGKRMTPAATGRKTISGADVGEGIAETTVQIPTQGEHHFWIRFAQYAKPAAQLRGPMRVVIRQAGKTVLDEVLDQTLDARLVSRSNPAVPPYRWHKATVTLQKGPAQIVFSKLGPEKANPRVRKIDCMVLTTDLDYVADERDWGQQTYMRIDLNEADSPQVYFQCFINHMRAPYYERAVFDSSDMFVNAMRSTGKNDMKPGSQSTWFNISRLLDGDWDSNLSFLAMGRSTSAAPGEELNHASYTLNLAPAPHEDAVAARMKREGPGAGMVIRIGSHVDKDSLPRSDLDIARAAKAIVESLPPVDFGQRPVLFPVMTEWRARDQTHTPGTEAIELDVMKYLGINANANWPLTQAAVDSGILFTRAHLSIFFRGPAGYSDPKTQLMTSQIKNRKEHYQDASMVQRAVYMKLMDEATATPLAVLAANPANQRAFKQWLPDNGYNLQSLKIDSWDKAIIPPHSGAGSPELYLAAQRYRAASIADFFSVASKQAREHFHPTLPTAQNFSDGAVYMANMYAQGNDYFTWFSKNALDMAISEDWTALGSTPQCCGWNVALLRAATREHQQPIGMYVISYGPALDTKLRAYSDMAQGAKSLNFYAYGPRYQGHENGWSQRPDTYRAIAEITHEIGAAEHILIDAMPPKATTAIIYSVSSDIWDVARDNAMGHERMHTYLALRHGQVAVDVLSEDDVIQGKLHDYKCAYLFGDQLDQQIIMPLSQWVKGGGTLVLSAGAGQKNELNSPSRALDQQLSFERKQVDHLQSIWIYGRGLFPMLQSKGKVTLGPGGTEIDLLARRQVVTPSPNAKILATFNDGTPASIMQDVGNGRVILHGFTPALAYVRDALEKETQQEAAGDSEIPDINSSMESEAARILQARESQIPTRFDAALRQFIVQPAQDYAGIQPVSVDTPLVEATLLQGSKGWVVTLANYTGQPLNAIEVTIHVGRRSSKDLATSRIGNVVDLDDREEYVRVRMPLPSTDMIHAAWND